MSRYALVVALLLVAVVGCGRSAKRTPTRGPIDYSDWQSFTDKMFAIEPELFSLCDDRGENEQDRKERLRTLAVEKYGPHVGPSLRLFANDLAMEHLRTGRPGPLPVGAAIVKEKWLPDADTSMTLIAYAAMIKHERGYDPSHGDWEYLYVDLADEDESVERGKLPGCRDCHARAATKDYLFRTHLKDSK